MQNQSERKKKLEQQRLILINRIKDIDKYQDELMLRGILLNAYKDELRLKSQVLEQLINHTMAESTKVTQLLNGPFKMGPDNLTLYMN